MTATAATSCVYCGDIKGPFQAEHVVPRCLWAGGRPSHLITIPACDACNKSYGADEEYFRTALAVMAGLGSHPQVDRLLGDTIPRSLTRRNGRLQREITLGRELAPYFTPSGLFAGWRWRFRLDFARFNRCVEKTVRGLFWYKSGRPLSPDYAVHVYQGNGFWADSGFQALQAEMNGLAGVGDSVFSCRCTRQEDDHDLTVWQLGYYETLGVFAWTARLQPPPQAPGQPALSLST